MADDLVIYVKARAFTAKAINSRPKPDNHRAPMINVPVIL